MSDPAVRFIKIFYVQRSELAPAFGKAKGEEQEVYVRRDLPACVRANVLCHELFHIHDETTGYFKREIRANLYAGIHFPLGFILGTLMTLCSRERVTLYYKLIKSALRGRQNGK